MKFAVSLDVLLLCFVVVVGVGCLSSSRRAPRSFSGRQTNGRYLAFAAVSFGLAAGVVTRLLHY